MAKRFIFQTLSRLSRGPLLFSHTPQMPISSRYFFPSCFVTKWEFQVSSGACRYMSHGRVNLVISDGNPKFETYELEPLKKEKFQSQKQFKMKRKREKQKRKAANKRDPRSLTVKGKKKQKFQNAAERITNKIEKARIKEALLVERLKKYEIPRLQGPCVEPENLTGEERFYLKKISQKGSNYAPIGRRGIFGGVIQNMHMHWKKHETVKVVCNKACKRGVVQEYAKEIARLSGGTPIQVIGNDTIVFYRGKNYEQPKEMIPLGTLSKKKALEKSKYEQSMESVRRFIAISEKELELYYRHVALYGDPNKRDVELLSMQKRVPVRGVVNDQGDALNSSCEGLSDDDSSIEDPSSDLSDVDCISEIDDSSEGEIDCREINVADFSCPSWFSHGAALVIRKMLDPKPKTRIRIEQLKNDPWFRRDYVAVRHGEDEEVNLDDVSAVFDDIEDKYVSEQVGNEERGPIMMNAFEMITLSQGLNLSALFDRRQDCIKRQTRFVSRQPAKTIISTMEAVAESMKFKVHLRDYKMRLEDTSINRTGPLAVVLEVFEVAPSLFMVDARKASGDTLEYHKFYKTFCGKMESIIWKPNDESGSLLLRTVTG